MHCGVVVGGQRDTRTYSYIRGVGVWVAPWLGGSKRVGSWGGWSRSGWGRDSSLPPIVLGSIRGSAGLDLALFLYLVARKEHFAPQIAPKSAFGVDKWEIIKRIPIHT